jgi:YggT family protein
MIVGISLLSWALWAYTWVIVARALLSWLPLRQGTASYKVYGFLYDVTEPYLQIFRRVLKPLRLSGAAVDLSPLIGLVVLYIALRLLALVS